MPIKTPRMSTIKSFITGIIFLGMCASMSGQGIFASHNKSRFIKHPSMKSMTNPAIQPAAFKTENVKQYRLDSVIVPGFVREKYSYDESNQTCIAYLWDSVSGTWVNAERVLVSNDPTTQTLLFQEWDSATTAWIDANEYFSLFDSNGRHIQMEYTSHLFDSKSIYTYYYESETDRLSATLIEHFYQDEILYIDSCHITYLENGKPSYEINYIWDEFEFIWEEIGCSVEYKYNEKNLLIEVYFNYCSSLDTTCSPQQKLEYGYDSQDDFNIFSCNMWCPDDSVWVRELHEVFYYDKNIPQTDIVIIENRAREEYCILQKYKVIESDVDILDEDGVSFVGTAIWYYTDLTLNSAQEVSFLEESLVYPNPVTHNLQISIPDGDSAIFSLITLSGQLLVKEKIDGQTSISLLHLPAGLYVYQLTFSEKTISGKLIKE